MDSTFPVGQDKPWMPYREYLRHTDIKFASFMVWIETTQLYAAIKNRPEGVDFYRIKTPDFEFDLNMSAKTIKGAHDLPIPLLQEFFRNWPQAKDCSNVQKLLTDDTSSNDTEKR